MSEFDYKAELEEKFYSSFEEADSCWLWTANKNTHGYGRLYLYGSKYVMAHRYSYELLVDKIPSGLTIDHLCREHSCVNPRHLEPVTIRDNTLRGVGPTAMNAKKTHCPSGHPYSKKNTRVVSGKTWIGRQCKICAYNHTKRYRAQRKAKELEGR